MLDFVFHAPTKVFFGKGVEEQVGAVLKEAGFSKIMLVYGGGSVIRSGLLGRIQKGLEEAGLSWCELGGVEPNPKIGLVREGIELYQRENVDFVLAVGGGSVIDTAKSICIGIAHNMDPWHMIENAIAPKCFRPMGSVLTIAAAGSEMSWSHVITNPELNSKKSLNSDLIRPMFSFLNPENTFSVSPYQTACGIVDIMMHTLERYLCASRECDLTDRLSEGLLMAVRDAGRKAMANPRDYEARSTLMWASSLSHNGLTGCGKVAYWAAHKIDQDIAGIFDHVAHGAGLAVVFPAWAKYVYKYDVEKFAQLANRLWDVPYNASNPEETALAGIRAFEEYFKELGMPVRLRDLNVPREAFEQVALTSTKDETIVLKSYVDLGKKEIIEILELAY